MVTLEKATEILKKTQKILGLQDWQISLRIIPQKELKKIMKAGEDSIVYGCVIMHSNFRTAEMCLWDELDESDSIKGYKFVVRHECVHIILTPFDELFKFLIQGLPPEIVFLLGWMYTNSEERIINQISWGLIRSNPSKEGGKK